MTQALQTDDHALWKERFRALGILGAQVAARAPDRGLVTDAQTGAGQLYAWDVKTAERRQLTFRQEGVWGGRLSPDGKYVYYFIDEAGSETGHYKRIPWEGGREQDVTPKMEPYAAIYRCAVSQSGNMFAFTPTLGNAFPLYVIDLEADGAIGTPRELYRSPKFIDDAALSHDGAVAIVATTEFAPARQYSLLAFDTGSGKRMAELSDLPDGSLRALAFQPDDCGLLATSDRSGYIRPLLWNPRTGDRTEIALPDIDGDVQPLGWSAGGESILLCQVHRAMEQLYLYELASGRLTRINHPSGSGYSFAFFGPNDAIYAVWDDSTHLPRLVAINPDTGEMRTIISGRDDPPGTPLKSVSFPSLDGELIQGWLGVPEGAGPFPTVLEVHGGPLFAMTDSYNPFAQAWLDHGFAFLTLNYRGSTTFGRDFKEKIWGDLGHWEVEDMAAGVHWLIDQGIAEAELVFVTGASYGGYLTLMVLGKHPHLWAGGMAIVASADLVAEYQEGTDWSRGYLTAMMGGTLDEKRDGYIASSPSTYCENIDAPLLVIQGRNDIRCPAGQMVVYADKMQALGKRFEIEWFDAGHGGLELDAYVGWQERIMGFALDIVREREATASPTQV